MINLERTSVMNMENAIRGMRNPMNSWDKSDSDDCFFVSCNDCVLENAVNCDHYVLGENDLNLAIRLAKAGTDHGKFLRQIFVSVDITAPFYWWKEFDTYKVGTVSNSCSTMHKIHSKEITLDDFSIDNFTLEGDKVDMELKDFFLNVVADCEVLRQKFLETKDKRYWRGLVQLLPSSYNQMRTCTLNYEVLRNMYHARKHHKLVEWHEFCRWVETLPYAQELIVDTK